MMKHVRPRANNGHVAFQYVDELGQFVQGCLPQKTANACQALVAPRGLQDVRLSVWLHGTEFQEGENPAVLAMPLLPEQDWST